MELIMDIVLYKMNTIKLLISHALYEGTHSVQGGVLIEGGLAGLSPLVRLDCENNEAWGEVPMSSIWETLDGITAVNMVSGEIRTFTMKVWGHYVWEDAMWVTK